MKHYKDNAGKIIQQPKEADKCSVVTLSEDNDIYEEVFGEIVSHLVQQIRYCVLRTNNRGDIFEETPG